MQFNGTDLDDAMVSLSLCKFFPSDPNQRAAIRVLLAKMVPSKEDLDWLVDQFVNHIGAWHGPKELRGVLCTKCRPSDGIEATSSLSTYTPEAGEMQYIEQNREVMRALPAGRVSADPELNESVRGLAARKALPQPRNRA